MTSGPYGDADHQPVHPATPGHGAPPTGYGYGYPAPPAGPAPYQRYPAPGAAGYPVGGYAYPQPRNGIGTAGLVLGIIGVVFCWLLWIGWTLNILAIIFGGVGLSRARNGSSTNPATNRSSAMAGLVLGIIGLVLGIGIWVALGAAWRATVWTG